MAILTRRQFGSLTATAVTSSLTRSLWAREAAAQPGSHRFYFALIADTHIIDSFYVKGSENGVEDNESILATTPRMTSARDLINSLDPAIEQVFLIGDYFHNYPSTDYDFYFKNTTRLDNAKAITDGFRLRKPRLRCPSRSARDEPSAFQGQVQRRALLISGL